MNIHSILFKVRPVGLAGYQTLGITDETGVSPRQWSIRFDLVDPAFFTVDISISKPFDGS
jgi:hypothetical protein